MTIECNNQTCKNHCTNSGDPYDEGPFCYEEECRYEPLFPAKERAFLVELVALSRKHNIVVSGCGCCGSPSLEERDCSDPEAGYGAGKSDVEWLSPGDYEWERYKGTVVR